MAALCRITAFRRADDGDHDFRPLRRSTTGWTIRQPQADPLVKTVQWVESKIVSDQHRRIDKAPIDISSRVLSITARVEGFRLPFLGYGAKVKHRGPICIRRLSEHLLGAAPLLNA